LESPPFAASVPPLDQAKDDDAKLNAKQTLLQKNRRPWWKLMRRLMFCNAVAAFLSR
jgi:hypothetical protein